MWTFKIKKTDVDEFGYKITTNLKWDIQDCHVENLYKRLIKYCGDNELWDHVSSIDIFHNGKRMAVARCRFHVWMIEGTRTPLSLFLRG